MSAASETCSNELTRLARGSYPRGVDPGAQRVHLIHWLLLPPVCRAKDAIGCDHGHGDCNAPMPHAPFLAASPLAMPPLGYVAPFRFPM